MKIEIEEEFARRNPDYRVMLIEGNVANSDTSDEQKREMEGMERGFTELYKVEDINKRPAIAATRAAYKRCGKDPNRYRPSQEQLMRRIVRGLGLYNVNAIVDSGNMLSLASGCSVGCFDRDKIEGDVLRIGIGREGEPYEGIGRGPLNVEGLPIVRDAAGGIGTPTSDNERTKVSESTEHLVMTIHLFDPAVDTDEVLELVKKYFVPYAALDDMKVDIVKAS